MNSVGGEAPQRSAQHRLCIVEGLCCLLADGDSLLRPLSAIVTTAGSISPLQGHFDSRANRRAARVADGIGRRGRRAVPPSAHQLQIGRLLRRGGDAPDGMRRRLRLRITIEHAERHKSARESIATIKGGVRRNSLLTQQKRKLRRGDGGELPGDALGGAELRPLCPPRSANVRPARQHRMRTRM